LCILWQKIVLGYFHYLQMIEYFRLNIDGFVKSRHSGENWNPETLQLKKLDSGFRRNDKKWCFSTFYEFINIEYLRNSFPYKRTIIKNDGA